MIDVKFVKVHEDAILPKRAYDDNLLGDACFDLFSVENIILKPGERATINVGLKVGFITPGYWFKIENRSGNGFKKGLRVHPGIIDNSYRGNIGVMVWNLSDEIQTIEAHKGVAQILIHKMIPTTTSWIDSDDVKSTVRGEKGFGSSDK